LLRAADPRGAKAADAENKLIGTWRMISATSDGQESDEPKRLICIKHVTPTHWMWAHINPETKKIEVAACGTYTLKNDSYVEIPLYTLGEGVEELRDRPQRFTWRIEGNKWYHTGELSDGLKLAEVWERQVGEVEDK
jgi:hypothetical protein